MQSTERKFYAKLQITAKQVVADEVYEEYQKAFKSIATHVNTKHKVPYGHEEV